MAIFRDLNEWGWQQKKEKHNKHVGIITKLRPSNANQTQLRLTYDISEARQLQNTMSADPCTLLKTTH